MLGFAIKRYDGKIPAPEADFEADDTALLAEVKQGFKVVGDLDDSVKLRSALEEARRLTSASISI